MIPGSANPLLLASAAAAGGYAISRSLRFNSADSAYLSRTPASAGNRKTWTWAGWFKNGVSGFVNPTHTYMVLFGITNGTSAGTWCNLFYNNQSRTFVFGDWAVSYFISTAVFRDPSAWMHVVLSVDTTQATASNQVKLYINGTLQDGTRTAITQNTDLPVNAAVAHNIGADTTSQQDYLYGYLADIHFIDGQALDPTSFGEFDATTGVWVPKAYTGTYGTNGFRLDFSDNSAATATTLGKDRAGSNNWTPNNLSVTAGAGNDSLVDVPTNGSEVDSGLGGQVRGNYCTWNPLVNFNSSTLSNGNLDIACVTFTGQWRTQKGGWGFYGGKYYFEVTVNAAGSAGNAGIGIGRITLPHTGNVYPGQSVGSYAYTNDGGKVDSGSVSYPWATYTTGDVIGVAVDLVNGTVEFRKNNALQGSMTGISTSETYEVLAGSAGATAAQYTLNAGARPFAYTAPSGFKALNTANLPAPVVTKPSTVMDVALWTGNGSARSITGLAFNPDLVWIKGRSGATDHALYDAVRGVQIDLVSNSTAAETTQTQGLTAFNSDGFSLGTLAKVNTSSATYACWAWDAGSSTVTNTSGSISSQVRANASAGFSVVTYTGTGANATVGHGLGVAPGMVIVKRRNSAANWQVRHTSIAAANSIQLNLNNAAASATTVWNSTVPSSTVFSIGTDATVNASGGTYVAYCFAPVVGLSAHGSYTGNGSTDGPFVYTGFRPRWLMVKKAVGGTSDWWIWDTARDSYNVADSVLYPNIADSEVTDASVFGYDILSNGFKVRNSNATQNNASHTYIYAAFAEHPFQYARAR